MMLPRGSPLVNQLGLSPSHFSSLSIEGVKLTLSCVALTEPPSVLMVNDCRLLCLLNVHLILCLIDLVGMTVAIYLVAKTAS